MGTPYKMKGSPMQRNFGYWVTSKTKTRRETRKKKNILVTFTPKRETSWWKTVKRVLYLTNFNQM
jgi:hypothetical protein